MKYALIYSSVTSIILLGAIYPWHASLILVASSNSVPTVDATTIALSSLGAAATEINLIENSATTAYIHGTASDTDGCAQIDDVSSPSSWAVVFYRTNVTGGSSCANNESNCYQVTEQNSNLSGCSGPGDPNLAYEMTVPVQFYADATDVGSNPDYSATAWTASVTVTDDIGASGSRTATTEINTLKALNVITSISYGNLDLGATSAEQTVVITNTGNDNDLDPTVRQTDDWTCTNGTIAAGNTHWNLTAGQGYAAGTAMTQSAVDLNNLSISKSTGSASTKNIYTMLQLPAQNIGGTCSSTLEITAA